MKRYYELIDADLYAVITEYELEHIAEDLYDNYEDVIKLDRSRIRA